MKKKANAFTVFFTQLPRLMLAALIFGVILAGFCSISILAGRLTGMRNIIVSGLGIIPSAVFLPGLVMVVRKYAVEKKFVPVVKTFFEAVRDNYKQFIVHGVVMYAIASCSAFAIIYYGTAAMSSAVYSAVFTIYLLFSLVLLVMLFYLPVMSVTYELRLRDLYKNSLLLVFGTVLKNLAALIYTLVIGAGAVLLIIYTEGVWRYVAFGAICLLCPLLISYGVISIIAKGLQENVGSFTGPEPVERPILSDEEQSAAEAMNTEDDYVFVGGKMIKNPNKKA